MSVQCPGCGTAVQTSMRICPQCGIPLNLRSTYGPEQGPPIGVGTIVLGVMSVLVLGMLCVCGAGLWMYQSAMRTVGLPSGGPPMTAPAAPMAPTTPTAPMPPTTPPTSTTAPTP